MEWVLGGVFAVEVGGVGIFYFCLRVNCARRLGPARKVYHISTPFGLCPTDEITLSLIDGFSPLLE
jgi:hypothetical protein